MLTDDEQLLPSRLLPAGSEAATEATRCIRNEILAPSVANTNASLAATPGISYAPPAAARIEILSHTQVMTSTTHAEDAAFEYPGLRDRVNIYTIDARVHGLPVFDDHSAQWRWHPVSMGAGTFLTPHELLVWLSNDEGGSSPRVDLSLWGHDGVNTTLMEEAVARLWHELEESESKLTFDEEVHTVRRQTSVAKVCVRHPQLPGQVLINTSVVYSDGKVEHQDKLLSGKLKTHEDASFSLITEGAKRAILEELGRVMVIDANTSTGGGSVGGKDLEQALSVVEHSLHYSEELTSSSSTYPGIAELRCVSRVDVCVDSLPMEGFESSEWKDERRRSLTRRLRWEWKKEADVALLLQ